MFPGAAQNEVVRCRPGIVKDLSLMTIPDQRCIAYALHRVRETRFVGTPIPEAWRRNHASRPSLHHAVFGVGVAVPREHLLDDLGLVFAVRTLGDLGQIEVLDRVMVGVELERAAAT